MTPQQSPQQPAPGTQETLCTTCARADVDCPIYPQQTTRCVEHRAAGQPSSCNWHQEDDDGAWHSDCGSHFTLNEGTPSENGMAYCHKCGKPLQEHPWTEDEHEAGENE